jgi:hypothetical protein
MKTISLWTIISLLAVGCSKSEAPKDQPGTAPGTQVPAPAPAAPVKPADWSRVDKVFAECMSIGLELAMARKVADIKTDPDYFSHCEAGLARAEAKIAINNSKPNKMDSLCIAASMKAEEIAGSDRPEAAEFKKIDKDVKKACGL